MAMVRKAEKRVVDINGRGLEGVRTIPEADAWGTTWGVKVRPLVLSKKVEDPDSVVEAGSMRSPGGRLVVDLDGSMKRQLIADINERRTQRNRMLLEMWQSGRVPPYMDLEERQLRYRIDHFRKRRLVEGRGYQADRIPNWTGRCAFCDGEDIPLKDMGLVDEYMWGCGSCRGRMHDHTMRDDVRTSIDTRITELLNTTSGDLQEAIVNIKSVRDRLKAAAANNGERRALKADETQDGGSKEPEGSAFGTIYGTPIINKAVDTSATLDQLVHMSSYEGHLSGEIAKQHRTVFAERYMKDIITTSVTQRQQEYLRRFEAVDRLRVEPAYAIRLWEEQGDKCAWCGEAMFWNWAVGGRARLAQLDRVEVTKATYVDNCVWLCQSCNRHKGLTQDLIAYDQDLLEALERATGSQNGTEVLKSALTLQLTRQALH